MNEQQFFCDNCGARVDRNESRCPRCGRFFRFVRCPACGYTDTPGHFSNGCPVCGYAEKRPEVEFGRGRKKKSGINPALYRMAIPFLLVILAVCILLLIGVSFF